MNASDSLTYWQKRWSAQGPGTVGHAGDSDTAARAQTLLYGTALQNGLRREKSTGFRYPTLLDYGCGWGRMLDWLRPQTELYQGMDIAAAGIDTALKHWPDLFEVLTYPEIEQSLPAKAFTAVVCCTVLQHIVDPVQFRRTCKALRATLTPGGRLVLLENVSELGNKPHITYRHRRVYMDEFPLIHWLVGDGADKVEVTHRGEVHALLVGDAT